MIHYLDDVVFARKIRPEEVAGFLVERFRETAGMWCRLRPTFPRFVTCAIDAASC